MGVRSCEEHNVKVEKSIPYMNQVYTKRHSIPYTKYQVRYLKAPLAIDRYERGHDGLEARLGDVLDRPKGQSGVQHPPAGTQTVHSERAPLALVARPAQQQQQQGTQATRA